MQANLEQLVRLPESVGRALTLVQEGQVLQVTYVLQRLQIYYHFENGHRLVILFETQHRHAARHMSNCVSLRRPMRNCCGSCTSREGPG